MIENETQLTLKSTEVVDFTIVQGVDDDWLEPIVGLYAHKGEPWTWQNRQFLSQPLSFERRYYLLHRSGTPFAGMLMSDNRGVGILNHVWTVPKDRGKGASSSLLEHLMADFMAYNGKIMVLQTGFDSVAYHMYRKVGFESIELQSGYMHWYQESEDIFYEQFFTPHDTHIMPLDWQHWFMIQPLLQGNFNDTVRIVALRQLGRRSTEHHILNLLRNEHARTAHKQPPSALVLQNSVTDAVVGLASSLDKHLSS